MRVLQHAESNVARAAGNVEDLLGLAKRVRVARVQRRDEIIPSIFSIISKTVSA
jgi:hypothetical protein